MKRILLLILISSVFLDASGQSDEKEERKERSRWYSTSGGEMIFSLHAPSDPTNESTILRWSPVFNSQTMLNNDIGKSLGIYTGVAIRNVGFITEDPNDATIRRKFRTYNVGIPFGIKIGNLDRAFLYGGIEAEYAFNFKEKTFVNDEKVSKRDYWFTDRVNAFQPSVHLGIQFLKGTNIKFKYYLDTFFNPDRVDVYASEYERFDGNVFYFSLNTNLFQNNKFYYLD